MVTVTSHCFLSILEDVLVAAQLLFTYAPFMQAIFDTRPLSLADGALIVAVGVGLMLLLEVEKAVMRRLRWFEDLA